MAQAPSGREYRALIDLGLDESLEQVGRAAEMWGAEWRRSGTGGRLVLPVHAGLRHGFVTARLSARAAGPDRGNGETSSPDGTEVLVEVESSRYRLHTGPVAILGVGGFGALALILWPFYPRLLALAPLALIFCVLAWLLVASKLQNSGIGEFLEMVQSASEGSEAGTRASQS